MLGILYAAVGAFTFALNNVAMRGVVTGSVLQGIGCLSFLVITIAFGELSGRESRRQGRRVSLPSIGG